MTARLDATGSDGPEAALSPGDDPLAFFQQEGSGDGPAPRLDALASQAPSLPFAPPSVNDGKPPTAGVVKRIKRMLRALDIARDVEKTVDNRLAALRGLDQEVQDRTGRLERLNQEISVGAAHADDIRRALDIARDVEKTVDNRLATLRGVDQEVQDRAGRIERLNQEISAGAAHADDVLRAIGSFERPLADLQRHKQDLQAIETAVAAFENRAQAVSTSLGGDVAAWEARAAAVVDAMEQLRRRAADTIDDLEGRVGDCEARADIAGQTITSLYDVSSRTLPVLQERTKDAEEQNQSLERLVTEAVRIAASLTALEGRLPAVGQCDQDLARIELAVPQIARQLEDLNASAEQQTRALAVHQQRARQTLDESQKTAALVSELAGRIVDFSGCHQQLDRLEKSVTQLEQRAAAAVGEVRHATRAKEELQREIANCQQQIERLTTAAQGETEKLNGLRRHADYHGADRASSPSARDLLNTLRFLRPNTSRAFSPARLVFRGTAFALSAAIILLVGIVWRISPVENQRPGNALPARVLASQALTPEPTLAVAPPMPLTADIRHDRPEATRTTPAVPAVAGPLVVVSKTPVAARRVPTAAVREQSLRKGANTSRFVGTLLIESDPAGAVAFVNQESVGSTPVLLKNVRAGSYVVRLEHEGYQRWSTAATVSAVRQERVRVKLERERSR